MIRNQSMDTHIYWMTKDNSSWFALLPVSREKFATPTRSFSMRFDPLEDFWLYVCIKEGIPETIRAFAAISGVLLQL